MNEKKIIYSLNVYPLINNRWKTGNRLKETIYMTALSVLYSHLWYKDIELYVDDIAYKFLYMLPCRVTRMNQVNHDKDLWMKSKIQALKMQTKPFVHLDTDVFIKQKIDFDFDKILLERKEGGYQMHYSKQVEFFNNYTQELPFWNNDLGHSYNCGIIGFNDLNLRNDFIKAYYDLEEIYIEQKENFKPLKQKGFEPCIILEQYTLASLLDFNKIKPTLLLKGKNLIEQGKYADQIGYAHLFGVKKYKKEIIEEIEYRLFKIFPFWYAQVKTALEKHKIIEKENLNLKAMVP
jgi:hypothetical protein